MSFRGRGWGCGGVGKTGLEPVSFSAVGCILGSGCGLLSGVGSALCNTNRRSGGGGSLIGNGLDSIQFLFQALLHLLQVVDDLISG